MGTEVYLLDVDIRVAFASPASVGEKPDLVLPADVATPEVLAPLLELAERSGSAHVTHSEISIEVVRLFGCAAVAPRVAVEDVPPWHNQLSDRERAICDLGEGWFPDADDRSKAGMVDEHGTELPVIDHA